MSRIDTEQNNYREKTTTVLSILANITLLIGIPALAYLFGLIYELGFCQAFGIPAAFIIVQPNTLFVELGPLFLILVFLTVVGIAITRHLQPRTKDPLYLNLFGLLPGFLLTVGFILIWQDRWQIWAIAVFFFLYTAALYLLFPLFRKEKSYKDKLASQTEKNMMDTDALFDFLGWRRKQEGVTPRVGVLARFVVLASIAIVFIGLLCNQYGIAEAMRRREYFVSATHQDLVALRIYNDKMICAEVNMATKMVKSDLYILNSSVVSEQTWRLEKVGPLKPKPR